MNENLFLSLEVLKNKYPIVESVAIFCARWLPWIMLAFMVVIIIRHVVNRKHPTISFLGFMFYETISIIITLLITLGVVMVIKYNIPAPRPFVIFDIEPSFIHGFIDSFPSGHAALFFALAWIIGYFEKNIRWFFMMTAIIIGIARITVGIHYPIDIIVGATIGILIAMIVHRYIKNRVSTTFFTKNK